MKRLRALTLQLLPVEVDPAQLSEPTSRFISPQVIQAYEEAAGDFLDAVSQFLFRVVNATFQSSASFPTASFELDSCICGMRTMIQRIMTKIMDEVRHVVICTLLLISTLPCATAIACEVLARRILHRAAPDRLISIMSMRYRHLDRGGEDSDMTSALELAIDTNRFVQIIGGRMLT